MKDLQKSVHYLEQVGAGNKTSTSQIQSQSLANSVRRHSASIVAVGSRRWRTEWVVGLRTCSHHRLN